VHDFDIAAGVAIFQYTRDFVRKFEIFAAHIGLVKKVERLTRNAMAYCEASSESKICGIGILSTILIGLAVEEPPV